MAIVTDLRPTRTPMHLRSRAPTSRRAHFCRRTVIGANAKRALAEGGLDLGQHLAVEFFPVRPAPGRRGRSYALLPRPGRAASVLSTTG